MVGEGGAKLLAFISTFKIENIFIQIEHFFNLDFSI